MIVLILAGGLGNQMFEYAAAKAMALRNSTQLVINKNIGFQRDKFYKRVYCLNDFNVSFIKRRIISFDIPFGSLLDRISRKMGFHILCPWYRYFLQENLDHNDIIKPLKSKNVILVGGWISQDYFVDYLPNIRTDFTINKVFPNIVQTYVKKIQNSDKPVVAMGVRVYQEVQDTEQRESRYFKARGLFYNNALHFMQSKIGDFKLLIFTQVEEWVRNNVELQNIDYDFVNTSTSDADAINDMYVMSQCNHYIISNSTFYFWGCWLNCSNKKIVVVPKQWKDVPLESWVKL